MDSKNVRTSLHCIPFWVHVDYVHTTRCPLGTAGVMTNSSASVVSNNLYDVFGVKRYEQGSAQTPWRWARVEDEG
ncbi:MAG: hypothetical protein NZ749_10795 [bacterium]|nr:hypothetical protein [bacterium]